MIITKTEWKKFCFDDDFSLRAMWKKYTNNALFTILYFLISFNNLP